MTRGRTARPLLAFIAAATLILAVGGVAVASNMGFKLNKELAIAVAGPSGTIGLNGKNWISLPYNNPYGTFAGLCAQAGLVSAGIARSGATFICYPGNPAAACAGGPQTAFAPRVNCGTTQATTQPLPAGVGFILDHPSTGATSAIIVGSHNPTQLVTINKIAPLGQFFAVPYHTTAVTSADLCVQMGLTATGLNRGKIQRFISNYNSTGTTTAAFGPVYSCGGTTNIFNLVLGESVYVQEPVKASVSFIPAHY